MPLSKTMTRASNDHTLLSVLSMSVFLVGASEFMLSATLCRSRCLPRSPASRRGARRWGPEPPAQPRC